MHSLPTEPDTGSSSHTDRFDSQNTMDKKYNEVKGLNQKLMDYIKEQEKKNKQQYQTIKTKLDESRTHVRRLEDENITLKFELTASQEREKQLHKQLSEMKVLLKKYYNKAQSSEISSDKDSISSSPMIEPQKNPKLNRHHTTCLTVDTNQRQNGPAEDVTFELNSPKTAQPDMIHTKEEDSALLVMKEKGGSAGVSLEDGKNRQSLFSRKRDIQEITEKDSMDEKMLANSELSLYDTAASREADQKLHLDLTKCSLENRDNSHSNDKIHTVTHFPTHGNEYSPATADPLSKRKAQTLVLDVSGVPKTVENLLEETHLRRFNMLSQNIVALDFRPEISNDTLSAMKNPHNSIGDLDGALTRKSVLKYVPKTPGTRGQAFFPDHLSFPKPVHDVPLFQDFIVIGVDKEDLSSFAKNNPKQSRGSLKPKVLYSYPTPPSGMNEPPRSSIPEFAFPFGVSVRKLRSTPSFSDLNSIIFKTNDYQLKSKCFIFPLLSEDPTIDPPNLGDVIEKANPNHLLYNVCIYFKDFVNMTDKSTKIKSSKDFRYFKTYKLMCFVTQYPFINFFFETITTLFRLLKIERELELSKANPQDLLRYENLGETFTSTYFKEVVEKNLKKMLETPIPQFSKPLNIELQGNLMELPVQYQVEDASKGWILEAIWACIPVFNYISLKDLLWIFSAFILERKLVFLSKNIHLLTATMSVIRSLIKPFRYPFPLVYNLPEVLMAICDAPGAAIIGINKGESYLQEENLLTDYPSCIFICLDEEKIHVDKTANKLDIPQLGNIEKSLLPHYAKFNADLNYNIVDFSKKAKAATANKKTLKFAGNAEIREKCIKVLEIFKTTLEEKILKLIPVKPIVKLDKELDYPAISAAMLEKAGDSEKAFLKQFFETQIFIYHLEKHFEKR